MHTALASKPVRITTYCGWQDCLLLATDHGRSTTTTSITVSKPSSTYAPWVLPYSVVVLPPADPMPLWTVYVERWLGLVRVDYRSLHSHRYVSVTAQVRRYEMCSPSCMR